MHKRDLRLHGLSQDHHHALSLARRARRGDELDDEQQRALWDTLREEFQTHVLPHFEIEETLMFAPLAKAGEGDLVARSLLEHTKLKAMMADATPRLLEFGELLAAHVRFEEADVLSRAQTLLGDDALDALEQARPKQ